ncbi:CoA transferase [Gammaproteobacteria bacterium]|nr:CoA transferase [Gammaproteobacteria bacterium]
MSTTGPLDGLIVIDLTRVLAGPYATMVMADLGARVIKVEMPGSGDDARAFGPFVKGKSAYFGSLNRGKESIALNLKAPDDRAVFENLIRQGDILVENYRPGTLDKLGFGWGALQALNPGLIYAAISGFGQTGPYRNLPAYDMVVQAMGGIMSVTGHPGNEPARVGTSIGDITAGLFALSGILAAVVNRGRTGRGMMVDVGMLDCQVAVLENAVSRYLSDNQIPQPLGARHPSITPFDAFRANNDYLVIAAGNDTLFNKLCEALDRSDLAADERFASNDSRTQYYPDLKAEIENSLRSKSVSEWLVILQRAGVPCGPINNIEQVVNDEQIAARNMIIHSRDNNDDDLRMTGNPIKFTGFDDPRERAAAPELDADREQILALAASPKRTPSV